LTLIENDMSQNNDAPKKSPPASLPVNDAKPGGGGWRDPARRRGFSLGARGKVPATVSTTS
jgi:hypothetical protein